MHRVARIWSIIEQEGSSIVYQNCAAKIPSTSMQQGRSTYAVLRKVAAGPCMRLAPMMDAGRRDGAIAHVLVMH